MKKLVWGIAFIIIVFAFLVSWPCANGNRIWLINASDKEVNVKIYTDDLENIILDKTIQSFSNIKKYRVFVPYDTAYRIQVFEHNTENIIHVSGPYGYVTPHYAKHDFFIITNSGVEHAYWLNAHLLQDAIQIGFDICTCFDDYLFRTAPIKKTDSI